MKTSESSGSPVNDPPKGKPDCPALVAHSNPVAVFPRMFGVVADALRLVGSRMNEDFRLGVMVLCGLLSVLVMSVAAMCRLVVGDLVVGGLDALLVSVMVWAIAHAWRTGESDGPGLVIGLINTVWCVMLAGVVGMTALFWAFNVVVLNFLLTRSRVAILSSALLVAAMLVIQVPGVEFAQRLAFAAACALVAFNAFIFALRSSRQARRLEQLAARDPLTGVGNRRLFERDLEQAVQQARMWNLRPALAVMDLDHFKRINDQYGHEAGDQTLVSFAHVLRVGLRQTDRLYRIGGEEFVLLVTDCHEQGLGVMLEQVQSLVRSRLHCQGQAVTVSIGAALLGPHEQGAQCLARADRALYAAKRLGRDCTVFADDDPQPASPAIGPVANRRASSRARPGSSAGGPRRQPLRPPLPFN